MNIFDNAKFPVGPFEKSSKNPILVPQGSGWESKDVFNPAAVVKDGKVYLLYRAEDNEGVGDWNGTSRIGIAESVDGIRFTRHSTPVLVPTEAYELPGGCEDPRISQVGDVYYMTYTGFDGSSARMCLATSTDLFHWEKHGVLFPNWSEGSDKVWSKSGSILPEPINGRYIMFFGDTSIWMAESTDLLHWFPNPTPVMEPSKNPDAFDSELIEPGPQPFKTKDGIVLIYNAAKRVKSLDNRAGTLVYSAGQVLLSLDDPSKVLGRTEQPFFAPDARAEREGQVNNVVFIEGLVELNGQAFIYYGMADSKIGAATFTANYSDY
ncbi:glycoside hydrolase family 130 protein [Alicyclobacillus sp. SO9]|uniref:glycoside hydrolase family 130 protein n=1 Tax=Alicyclobacillus sp. SO9 TaxID=2665646 RepID=UPI0018E89952|nr:glycoside hydrolase family 130 protein [Alicyclobacillus sp. SO9]QQE77735.1 glycosidase [Alicyclobacillus sp. SO9]